MADRPSRGPTATIRSVCNLYHMAPRDHVEVYFRALVPDSYQHVAVGPFGAGAFLRRNARTLVLCWRCLGQSDGQVVFFSRFEDPVA